MQLLKNKKATHEYAIEKTYTAGVVLSGPEVKSLRNQSGSLTGSFIKSFGDELVLINAQISPYKFANNAEYDPKRTRKLLLRKKEITALTTAITEKGRALVPLSFDLIGNKVKLTFGLGRGLKLHDKRAKMKERTIQRDIAREMKRGR
ncbi:MAG: SsrA-binding protein [Patescibacteria group bacterium]|nr:MAG: SsrA-binding protein [Patescibacteria group bacterium]